MGEFILIKIYITLFTKYNIQLGIVTKIKSHLICHLFWMRGYLVATDIHSNTYIYCFSVK